LYLRVFHDEKCGDARSSSENNKKQNSQVWEMEGNKLLKNLRMREIGKKNILFSWVFLDEKCADAHSSSENN